MEIRSTAEAQANCQEFANHLLNLMVDMKNIKEDIKALKKQWNEEGVPTGIVSKAISQIISDKKKTDTELFELQQIKEWVQTDSACDDKIGNLAD